MLATDLYRSLRIQKPVTALFGRRYVRSLAKVELDITYACNLRCLNCNRSCRQAPTAERMTVRQIQHFVRESIARGVRWDTIRVMGGEPTLHPDLMAILDRLLGYVADHSPATRVQLATNGYGRAVQGMLQRVPNAVEIIDSSKTSAIQWFYPFNRAPQDSVWYSFADYTNGCEVPSRYGIGLTPYGYYMCAIAGGIDRVFGFDVGRKALPSADDLMCDQLRRFCRLCGLFNHGGRRVDQASMSPTWRRAYHAYAETQPSLTRY